MLFEIVITLPSLVLAEIAWCIRFAVAFICLMVLFAVAIGIIGLRWRRDECLELAPIAVTSLHRADVGHRSRN